VSTLLVDLRPIGQRRERAVLAEINRTIDEPQPDRQLDGCKSPKRAFGDRASSGDIPIGLGRARPRAGPFLSIIGLLRVRTREFGVLTAAPAPVRR
jgi:hypothetical protein